jgi:hypothetical protein
MVFLLGGVHQPKLTVQARGLDSSFSSTQAEAIKVLFVYSDDCGHCQIVLDEIVKPLQMELGDQFEIRLLDIGQSKYFRLLETIEEKYRLDPGERRLPIVIVNDQALSGEAENRAHLSDIVWQALSSGSSDWPSIPGFDPDQFKEDHQPSWVLSTCTVENPDSCEAPQPIYAAYFIDTSCQACSGAYLSLSYIQSRYPQLIVEEFDASDYAAMGEWLSRRSGRGALKIPALFIGSQSWIGDKEIQPVSTEPVLEDLTPAGSAKAWEPLEKRINFFKGIFRFYPHKWIMTGIAGLAEGLSPLPIAIAAIIIFLAVQMRIEGRVYAIKISLLAGMNLICVIIQLQHSQIPNSINLILNNMSRWAYVLGAAGCFLFACYAMWFSSRTDGNQKPGGEAMLVSTDITGKVLIRLSGVVAVFLLGALTTLLGFSFQGQLSIPTMQYIITVLELKPPAAGLILAYSLFFILPTATIVFILNWVFTRGQRKQDTLSGGSARFRAAIPFMMLTVWMIFGLLNRS